MQKEEKKVVEKAEDLKGMAANGIKIIGGKISTKTTLGKVDFCFEEADPYYCVVFITGQRYKVRTSEIENLYMKLQKVMTEISDAKEPYTRPF